MREMKRLSGNQITVLVLLIILIAGYFFFLKPLFFALHNMAMGDDAERAHQLCDYVSHKIKIEDDSLSKTDQLQIFWDTSRNAARLEICGVTNSTSQEQIFEAIKEWQSTNQSLSKVRVQFFESDQPRGEYGQHINMLREEFIVLTNTQSGVIFNQAATKN
jgi:uncharacterized protein YpuA (DUF1002 family)